MQETALLTNLTGVPDNGRGFWLKTADGVRIRTGLWYRDASRGTVLLFPGRTEYIEKYGGTATDLAERGYATFTVDWRGQGLADRLTANPLVGHVGHFLDYQHDVAALIDAAKSLDLPRPWHLLGHSMGGAIGLRALLNGLPVASASFSAPMWGIKLSPLMRGFAWAMSAVGIRVGAGARIAPTSTRQPYVLATDFKDNLLTNDREMYQQMIDQLKAEPRLSLCGPSLRWVNQALREARDLARQGSPDTPCLTILGTREGIVDPARIRDRMRRWPNGELAEIKGGQHETLLDSPQVRGHVITRLADHYDKYPG